MGRSSTFFNIFLARNVKKDIIVLLLSLTVVFVFAVIFVDFYILMSVMFGILLVLTLIAFTWNMRSPSKKRWVKPSLAIIICMMAFMMILSIKSYSLSVPRGAIDFNVVGCNHYQRFDDSQHTQDLMNGEMKFYAPYNEEEEFDSFLYFRVASGDKTNYSISVDFRTNINGTTKLGFANTQSFYIDDPGISTLTYIDATTTPGGIILYSFNAVEYDVQTYHGNETSPTYQIIKNPSGNYENNYVFVSIKGDIDSAWKTSVGELDYLIIDVIINLKINGTSADACEYVVDYGYVRKIVPLGEYQGLDQFILIGTTILSVWLMAIFASVITGKMDLVMIVTIVLLMFSILAMLVMIGMELNASWVGNVPWPLDGLAKILAVMVGVVKWSLSIGGFVAICLVLTVFYAKAKMQ
jgi:hypothetical protein